MQIIEAYYTIYYGFRRYRYNSKPPTIGRRKVARKLGIPAKNIDIGITKDFPLWSPPNKACTRRAKVRAQKGKSKSKKVAKPARG